MIGPYRLERVLGTGSFATVWLAFDDVLDRKVAVKILADNWSRDNDVRRRFLAEARVLLTVESPRIVRGFHIGESPTGQPYLVMAYADRGTLGDRIEQHRREGRTFDAQETVGIATEVAFALVDVHASGHLHRDVKPTNVLIRSSSTHRNIPGLAVDETIVLGDFGLARGLDLSALTMVAGSPGYVAPEQAAGLTQLDRRADLYPLGRMMLEMLAGEPGGRATTMASAATEQVDVAAMLATGDSRSGAPDRALVDLITRLVAKNPDERPSSAEEVAAALVGVARGSAATAAGGPGRSPPLTPPSAPPLVAISSGVGERTLTGTQLAASPTPSRGPLRRKGAVAAAALLALAAIVAVVVAVTRDGGGGGSGTTTTAPVLLPDSSSDAASSAPETTSLALETTSLAPESSAADPLGRPISTAPDSTAPATEPDSTNVSATLVLPAGTFSPDALGSALLNPDRQQGTVLMSADEFAAVLVEANPDWTGEPPEPDPDGTLDFELTGFGRTASIHIEPAAPTSGAVIVAFTIEYG
jgi:serine/threonine protein kinase